MNYEKLDSIVLSLKDELLADMKRWIAVPSVLSESAGPNAPFGKANREMLDLALETARKYGFEARDVDGFAGDVSMGSGEKTLGILCHLDVVPAGDGWKSDPFCLDIENAGAHAVEGTDPHPLRVLADKPFDSRFHLACSLVGKGNGSDGAWRGTGFQKM